MNKKQIYHDLTGDYEDLIEKIEELYGETQDNEIKHEIWQIVKYARKTKDDYENKYGELDRNGELD